MGKRDLTSVQERDSRKLQIIRQRASSVSRAIWPTNIRQSYAVEKFAPRKRPSSFHKTWQHLREYCAYLRFRLLSIHSRLAPYSAERTLYSAGSKKKLQTRVAAFLPETPMPSEPLVRVLETYDLSQSDIEHFLNSEESRAVTVLTCLEPRPDHAPKES